MAKCKKIRFRPTSDLAQFVSRAILDPSPPDLTQSGATASGYVRASERESSPDSSGGIDVSGGVSILTRKGSASATSSATLDMVIPIVGKAVDSSTVLGVGSLVSTSDKCQNQKDALVAMLLGVLIDAIAK